MVRLKNIIRKDNRIICDAYVEDCSVPIALAFDERTGILADVVFPSGYEYCTSHIYSHARRFLASLRGKEHLPSERIIMWY